jgi:GNAT superfamily N-acetyltransferase
MPLGNSSTERKMSCLADRQANSRQKQSTNATSPSFGFAIHRLTGDDEFDMRDLLLGLDGRSRSARFGYSVSDESLLRHVNYALTKAFRIIGARKDKKLCGLVELYESNSGWVEAAFVVDQAWRRQGIASTLLRAAKEAATEIDIEVLRMIFPRDNWPMRQLANKANAKFDMVLDELSAEVAVSFN